MEAAQTAAPVHAGAATAAPTGTIRKGELIETERALMSIIQALQLRTGWCFASDRYLADALGAAMDHGGAYSERHLKRLLAKLQAKGCIASRGRRGQTTLRKVIRDVVTAGAQAVDWRIRGVTSRSPGGVTSKSRPGVTRRSPNLYSRRDDLPAARPGKTSDDPLFQRRHYFNPLKAEHRRQDNGAVDYDNRPPQQRVANARTSELILFVEHESRERFIASAKWSNTALHMELVVEETAGVTEPVVVPAARVGGLKLWR